MRQRKRPETFADMRERELEAQLRIVYNEAKMLRVALEKVREERAHGLTANSDYIDRVIADALALQDSW